MSIVFVPRFSGALSFKTDLAGARERAGARRGKATAARRLRPHDPPLLGSRLQENDGATVTLNVDSLGAKPLRSSPGVELLAGTIIQGTPYVAIYNNSDAAFYLRGFFGNPYNVPLGAGMDYWLPTAPNSSFVFPIGQAISRTTYATLFSAMGTTYGTGDGSTTFNLPDKTGRVSAMKEASATRLTSAGGGVDGAAMGAIGGSQNGTILQANLPAATLATMITDPGHTHGKTAVGSGSKARLNTGGGLSWTGGGYGETDVVNTFTIDSSATGITASTALGGSGTAFKLVQPTIVCNYIMRII